MAGKPPGVRAAAREAGLPHYTSPRPCPKGHTGPRFVSSGRCCECSASDATAWNKSEQGLAKAKAWRQSPRGRKLLSQATIRQLQKPIPRTKNLLRQRLRDALNRSLAGKTVSAVKDLGCTFPEFMAYCEAHPNWMPHFTWENHGQIWHIDHIKSLGLFDLTDPLQLRQAVHYTNLQPLETALHRIKTVEDTRLILAQRTI